jgi:hypothetical protein
MDQVTNLSARRIPNAKTARDLWGRFRKASITRRAKLAKVQNQLDGNPPFTFEELVKSGQGWRCNVNFRDASSTLEQVLISYWKLLHDAPNLAAVSMDDPEDAHADKNTHRFQDAFNRFIEDWGPDYVHQYLQFSSQHLGMGIGIPYFPDNRSPRWETVRTGEFECPPRTKTTVKSLNVFQVRSSMEIEDLWRKVRTKEHRTSSSTLGWNVSVIEHVLAEAIKDDGSRNTDDDVLEMQRKMTSDAMGESAGRTPVRVIHTYAVDYDDKVTHTIVAEDIDGDEPLFDDHDKSNRASSMSEVVAPVFFDSGNGDFWGVKGFGVKNHEISATTNRLKSRAVDRTVIEGLNFTDKRDGEGEVPAIISVGPFNILPQGLEQLKSYPGGNAILETVNMLDAQFNTNNARFRDNARQVSNANTATEANLLANMQSNVDVANATLYLHQVARNIFTEQFRRLRIRGNRDEDAKKFFRRCVTEGKMDEGVFHDAEVTVRSGSDPGAANLAVRGEKAIQLMNFKDGNQRFASETWVAANFGSKAIPNALLPIDGLEDKDAQNHAIIENGTMGDGNPLPVSRIHNHGVHATIHLEPLQIMVDQYDKTGQVDPESLIALQFIIPHVEEHLTFLKEDKTEEALYRQLWPMFTGIRSAAEGMFRQAERLAQQQQGGGGQPQSLPGAVGASTPQ